MTVVVQSARPLFDTEKSTIRAIFEESNCPYESLKATFKERFAHLGGSEGTVVYLDHNFREYMAFISVGEGK